MKSSTTTFGDLEEQWSAALPSLRNTSAKEGGIWAGLLRLMPSVDSASLAIWLESTHGVVTLGEQQMSAVVRATPFRLPTLRSDHVCLLHDGRNLLLCEDPWAPPISMALSREKGARWKPVLAQPGQLLSFGAASPLTSAVEPKSAAPASGSVVEFVDLAIARAYADGASDIHFETNRTGVGLKYRLDGVMAPGPRLEGTARAEEVVSRIKVLAQLDITERRRPQDGRIHWQAGTDTVDLRVSIMPSIFGEDAVLRLLDKAQLRHGQQTISLDVLGFDTGTANRLRMLAARPHGMLLMTGPTGSGKTTTVYAALSEVNDGLEKIITIEDPVEYELPGVLQIPVNEQKGLTFATGLRSILRHDPDKILVGEIRDAETAEIAVQSSLTGHLVFTTVHANSLFDVLGRFQHFGIEPFALASALNGVVVQRLLRRVCIHCVDWRSPIDGERREISGLSVNVPDRLPVAKGCPHCRQTGYRGRFVVAEVHEVNDAMRDLVVSGASMTELKRLAYANNSARILVQAMREVHGGTTTLEEVRRVIGLF